MIGGTRLHSFTIRYLQVNIVIGIVMCAVLFPFKSFDPMGTQGLEGLIMTDLYGVPEMPEAARPTFELGFLLFDALSILSFGLLLLVVSYPLQRRERWAYAAYCVFGLGWPAMATVVTIMTGAHAYFISVAVMTLMFTPPVFLLWPGIMGHRGN